MKKPSEIIKRIEEEKDTLEFISTGFPLFDSYIDGGFLKKELIILGGYTGFGKSYFAGSMFYKIAKSGFNCGYLSLEITEVMVVSRILGQIADIKPTKITYGLLEEERFETLTQAKAEVMAYDNFIHIADNLYKLEDIEKSIRKNNFDFVVIDFIQNIIAKGKEYERLSSVALSLQQLAKETNTCILILSQLSNEAYRKGHMEYKGSGSIATVCDLGLFLHRELDGSGGMTEEIELKIRKNRRGFSGKTFLYSIKSPGGKIVEIGEQKWLG